MDLIESKELRPIEEWVPFVIKMISTRFRNYCRCQADFDDLVSVGMCELVGLHNSITKRNVPNKNGRLYRGIYYRISGYVGKQSEIRKTEISDEWARLRTKKTDSQSTSRKVWLLKKLKSQLSPIYLETLEVMKDSSDIHEIARRLNLTSSGAYQRIMAIRGKAIQLVKEQTGGGMGWMEMWG